jgi:hypothetical protein
VFTDKNNTRVTRKDLLWILEVIARRREQEIDPGIASAAEEHIRERLVGLGYPDIEDERDHG